MTLTIQKSVGGFALKIVVLRKPPSSRIESEKRIYISRSGTGFGPSLGIRLTLYTRERQPLFYMVSTGKRVEPRTYRMSFYSENKVRF